MERAAHVTAERLVDELMLLELRLAGELLRDDRRRPMIPVIGQGAYFDLGVGDSLLDQGFDLGRGAWASDMFLQN